LGEGGVGEPGEGDRVGEHPECAVLVTMVASVDPRATVTTKSKAFILARVRFPEVLRNRTSAA
jgi:hypothetical protein